MKYKNYIKPLISDSIFIILFSATVFFSLRQIKIYFYSIQDLSPQLQNIESILIENASKFDSTLLNINLELMSQIINKIFLILITAILGIFIIYVITQSYSYLKKFNLNYLKKFTIVSIPCFLITIYLLFKIMVVSKDFIVLFWFENQTNTNILITIVILFLLILLTIHFFSLTHSYLIKNNIKTALSKTIKELKNYKLILKYLLIIAIIIIITIIAIRYLPPILKILSIIIILIIINYYRTILPR